MTNSELIPLWVDRFCINQMNHTEMAIQIPRINTIYNRAQETIIWIGQDDEHGCAAHLKKAFDDAKSFRRDLSSNKHEQTSDYILEHLARIWMKEAGIGPKTLTNFRALKRKTEGSPKLQAALQKLGQNLTEKDSTVRISQLSFLRSLENLMRQTYWERIWITQELASATDVHLWWGTETLDYNFFSEIVNELEVHGLVTTKSKHHAQILNLNTVRSKYLPGDPIHLLEALRDTYHTKSLIKHDEIYAILGLSYNGRRFVPIVDYGSELWRVVQSMTESYIISLKSIDVICLRDKSHVNPLNLPTWAPDWRLIGRSKFNHRVTSYLTGHDEHPKAGLRDKYWNATSKSRSTMLEFSEDQRTLHVLGHCLGTVNSHTGFADAEKQKLFENKEEVGTSLQLELDSKAASPLTRPVMHQKIFETMTIYKEKSYLDDIHGDWSDIFHRNEEIDAIKTSKPHVSEWINRYRNFVIDGSPLHVWSKPKVEKSVSYLYDILKRHQAHSWNKHPSNRRRERLCNSIARVIEDGLCLMTTNEGGVGWMHPKSKVGDMIYLLEGCSMPVVLRQVVKPVNNKNALTFKVIGDAYLHGAMNGERWQGLKGLTPVDLV